MKPLNLRNFNSFLWKTPTKDFIEKGCEEEITRDLIFKTFPNNLSINVCDITKVSNVFVRLNKNVLSNYLEFSVIWWGDSEKNGSSVELEWNDVPSHSPAGEENLGRCCFPLTDNVPLEFI